MPGPASQPAGQEGKRDGPQDPLIRETRFPRSPLCQWPYLWGKPILAIREAERVTCRLK